MGTDLGLAVAKGRAETIKASCAKAMYGFGVNRKTRKCSIISMVCRSTDIQSNLVISPPRLSLIFQVGPTVAS
jgi:hypothetical protein